MSLDRVVQISVLSGIWEGKLWLTYEAFEMHFESTIWTMAVSRSNIDKEATSVTQVRPVSPQYLGFTETLGQTAHQDSASQKSC